MEVVLKSGRRKAQVMEDARLIGQTSYIYEVGGGLVIDGEETLLTGEFQPRDGKTVHRLVEESGAPALLLEGYAGRLEHHAPWHLDRQVSHLFRGLVDPAEANELLARGGHGAVRLVDNGAIPSSETDLSLDGQPHAYHLVPAEASKAGAVARHMQARGYAPEECIGVGDSREDLDVAARGPLLPRGQRAREGPRTARRRLRLRQRRNHRRGPRRRLLRGRGGRLDALVTIATIAGIGQRSSTDP